MLDRVSRRLAAPREAQLLQNMADVVARRLLRDRQVLGYLLIRIATSDQGEHLALAFRRPTWICVCVRAGLH